ncbi:MAG: hypothetical protein IJV50_05135 [Lachnospiraceae bacterium]|nr:hypothetical protein [Lachnospiraceae bacterium]
MGCLLWQMAEREYEVENKKTNFYSLIHEICRERGIACLDYADGWAFELSRGEKSNFIFGYQFGLNLSSVQQLCNDKGAASEALEIHGIPHVHHIAYMCPPMQKFVGGDGCFQELLDVFAQEGRNLVVKDNEGTGGNLVFHVTSRKALEQAAFAIFSSCRSIALCPYYDILQEYRVVILDGVVKVIFSKIRQSLKGDGVSTLRQLYAGYLLSGGKAEDAIPESRMNQVLAKGEYYYLNWKHNLGQGAGAVLFTQEEVPEVTELALRTAKALYVRFGSFDVIRTADGIRILEVNTGVMMENLAGMSQENYALVKSVYGEAIEKMLASV